MEDIESNLLSSSARVSLLVLRLVSLTLFELLVISGTHIGLVSGIKNKKEMMKHTFSYFFFIDADLLWLFWKRLFKKYEVCTIILRMMNEKKNKK